MYLVNTFLVQCTFFSIKFLIVSHANKTLQDSSHFVLAFFSKSSAYHAR